MLWSRLLVGLVLAVPLVRVVARASSDLSADRPLFRSGVGPRFGARTALVAVLIGPSFVLAAFRFDESAWFEFLAYLALFAVLVLLSVVDLTEYRLPDVVVLPAIALGAVVVVVGSLLDDDPERILFAAVGTVVAFVVLLAAHLVSPQGMGFGDVKFAALLGMGVGWQATSGADALVLVLWMLLIGFGVGSIVGVVLWIVRRANAPFPFGPFLALGAVITVLASGALVG